VLEDEQAEKEATAIEVDDEEETPSEDDLEEAPEEIIDETEDTEEADEATEDSDDSTDYGSMTVAQLKELLKEAGKPVSGKKADLIERLKE
jgi:hypothetical protein